MQRLITLGKELKDGNYLRLAIIPCLYSGPIEDQSASTRWMLLSGRHGESLGTNEPAMIGPPFHAAHVLLSPFASVDTPTTGGTLAV
jgi:hypothetical protein